MNKPRIAIIGANEAINFLILKAKEKGYETHVFAWERGDPGEKSADFFYSISVAEKDKILDICKKLNISGVASITSDFAVNTVNYIARNLNLPCNSEKSDMLSRNKYLMRCAFRDAGLYTPWFIKIDKDNRCCYASILNYPVIIKPIDRWSSKGVTRVNDEKSLYAAVDYAIAESLTGEAIIEEFMDGPEYSAECICQNGNSHILTITEKITTGYPHYIETGHIEPAIFSTNFYMYLCSEIKKALFALDIRNSAAHAEFKIINNDQIGIIEVGARMGGDYIGTDLVRLTTGYDYTGMVIDVSCGKKLVFNRGKSYRRAQVNFILNQDDLINYERIKSDKNIIIERALINSLGFSHEVLSSSDRHGYYISVEE